MLCDQDSRQSGAGRNLTPTICRKQTVFALWPQGLYLIVIKIAYKVLARRSTEGWMDWLCHKKNIFELKETIFYGNVDQC